MTGEDGLVWHGGKWFPRHRLVMCSRCPLAMYAVLVKSADGMPMVVFWCEHCDRGSS